MLKDIDLRSYIASGLVFAFLVNTFGPMPLARAEEFRLPTPGTMVHLSPNFNPPILKGLKVHSDNPFRFDFILDKGDGGVIASPAEGGAKQSLKEESIRLIKYFLASLTIPEKDLWVNLSPYEKNRIVPESFGQTEMGRDLLAEDYILKQITASLIYPEGETGKKFWKRIYEESAKKFGTTNIPVSTFNKVWIVPDKAVVYENASAEGGSASGGKSSTAYVVEARLKVMLEQDYLSLQKHRVIARGPAKRDDEAISSFGSQIVRDIVIPQLTKEVNEGKNFAQLRQVYNSLILATWYKKKIKDSILTRVYADRNKIAGIVSLRGSEAPEAIFHRYLQAFKKGSYNYIKDEIDPATRQPIPRKYFSGGFDFGKNLNAAMIISTDGRLFPSRADHAMSIGVVLRAFLTKILRPSNRGRLTKPSTFSVSPQEMVVETNQQDAETYFSPIWDKIESANDGIPAIIRMNPSRRRVLFAIAENSEQSHYNLTAAAQLEGYAAPGFNASEWIKLTFIEDNSGHINLHFINPTFAHPHLQYSNKMLEFLGLQRNQLPTDIIYEGYLRGVRNEIINIARMLVKSLGNKLNPEDIVANIPLSTFPELRSWVTNLKALADFELIDDANRAMTVFSKTNAAMIGQPSENVLSPADLTPQLRRIAQQNNPDFDAEKIVTQPFGGGLIAYTLPFVYSGTARFPSFTEVRMLSKSQGWQAVQVGADYLPAGVDLFLNAIVNTQPESTIIDPSRPAAHFTYMELMKKYIGQVVFSPLLMKYLPDGEKTDGDFYLYNPRDHKGTLWLGLTNPGDALLMGHDQRRDHFAILDSLVEGLLGITLEALRNKGLFSKDPEEIGYLRRRREARILQRNLLYGITESVRDNPVLTQENRKELAKLSEKIKEINEEISEAEKVLAQNGILFRPQSSSSEFMNALLKDLHPPEGPPEKNQGNNAMIAGRNLFEGAQIVDWGQHLHLQNGKIVHTDAAMNISGNILTGLDRSKIDFSRYFKVVRKEQGLVTEPSQNWIVDHTHFHDVGSKLGIMSFIQELDAKRTDKSKPIVILDWGCGQGTALAELRRDLDARARMGIGIPNVVLYGFSDEHYPEWQKAPAGVHFILDTADHLKDYFRDLKVDLIYSHYGLVHLGPDPLFMEHLKELRRLMNDDGEIRITNDLLDKRTPALVPSLYPEFKFEDRVRVIPHIPYNGEGGIIYEPYKYLALKAAAQNYHGDEAMSANGGIDLASGKALRVQNNGQAVQFHIDPAQLQELQNAPGFVPVIISIQPLNDLKQFLGIDNV